MYYVLMCAAGFVMICVAMLLYFCVHQEKTPRGRKRVLRVFEWIRAAAKVQAKAPGNTGWVLWQPIKWILLIVDWQSPLPVSSKWAVSSKADYVTTLMKLSDELPTHFLSKLAKLPKGKPTLRRFTQLAWNIGQAEASFKEYNKKHRDLFNEHQLMEPTTYLSKTTLDTMGGLLPYVCVVLIYVYCQVVCVLSTCAKAIYEPRRGLGTS